MESEVRQRVRWSNDMYHHGVKGMRWGHRKVRPVESYVTKTKNGEVLTLVRNEGGRLGKALAKISPRIQNERNKTYNYNAYVNNKNVGELQMYKKSKDEMNITWGSTKKKYRGRGYMQAMERLGETIAKKYGAKKMTAELVGDSPDIHTVARKAGWVKVGEVRTQDIIDTWGGLTLVEKKLR